MQFGFSIPSAVFLAMLFVPNIMWARHQPEGYAEIPKIENPAASPARLQWR